MSLLRPKFAFLLAGFCVVAASVLHAQVPVITAITAPRQVVVIGQNLTLSVTATGATSYQWKRSGKPVVGATSASLTITGAQPARDHGWYQVAVTNGSGSVTSAVVFVNVAVSPVQVREWGVRGTSIESGLSDITAFAAGQMHNLALRADGTVTGWGSNTLGQIAIPAGLNNVVAIAGGTEHSVALKADGTVVAWGSNYNGESAIPSGLEGVVAIACGASHSLALKSDGTVAAWGAGVLGQTSVPAGLSSVVAIASGGDHNLVLRADGTLAAWGWDNGNNQTVIPTGLNNAIGVAAGNSFNVVLRADGTVTAWGYNSFGSTNVPAGLANVVSISSGNLHTIALKADGTVVTWGDNDRGQRDLPTGLGAVTHIAGGVRGDRTLLVRDTSGDALPAFSTQPASRAVNIGQPVQLSAAVGGGVAGYALQWRKNGTNILGATTTTLTFDVVSLSDTGNYDLVATNYLGSTTSNAATLTVNASPVVNATAYGRYVVGSGQSLTLTLDSAISGSATVQWRRNGFPISGATGRTLAITNAGRAANGYYQAVYNEGSGAVTSAAIFVVVAPTSTQIVGWGNAGGRVPASGVIADAVAISANSSGTFALRANGTVSAFGGVSPPANLNNVVAIAAGGSFGVVNTSLALRADGTVIKWGDVFSNGLNVPAGLSDVVAIAVSTSHALAVKRDGTVTGWGDSVAATSVPAGLSGVAAVSAGRNFSLALKSDGTVVGWGENSHGQSAVPAGLSGVVAISAGPFHAMALRGDGSVVAWGTTSGTASSVPAVLAGVVGISAGGYNDPGFGNNVVLKNDGTVVAWGITGDSVYAPPPPALNSVIGIAAGTSFQVALHDATGDTIPVFTTHPVGVSAYTGQDVVLSASASGGTSLLTYQWRKGGVSIPGAMGTTLSLSEVTSANAGSYDVVVTNNLGSITSNTAVITVAPTLAVSLSLTGRQTVAPGANVTLTATTALAGTATYQWRRNGRDIAGATSASLTVSGATWRDAGSYQVVVSTSNGSATSRSTFISLAAVTQTIAWGSNSSGQTSVPSGANSMVGVAGGEAHTVAHRSDGSVVAWGDNARGQSTVPSGLSDVVAVAAANTSSVALRGDGTVVAWGAINFTPTGLTNVMAVAAGFDYVLALKSNRTLVGWRSTDMANDIPAGLTDVTGIAVGDVARLALKADGTVVAWGSNSYGVLDIPAGLNNVVAIAMGSWHALAVKADGTVRAWGRNDNGQCNVPAGLTNVIAVAGSAGSSFALKADGSVVAWGSTANGLTSIPSTLIGAVKIAAGSSHVVAVRDTTTDGAPIITTQPVAATVYSGQTATFSVGVSANPPVSAYQWRRNGAPVSGATSATLTLANAQGSHAGTYDVVVTNSIGSTTSAEAVLTVYTTPVFSTQPVSTAVVQGQTATFTAAATGTPAPTYQWLKGGVNIPSATSATLTLPNVQPSDAGNYRVVASNLMDDVHSATATLTVNVVPVITTQPVATTVNAGNSATFSVSASGTPAPTYQWRKDASNISGATSATLTLNNVQASQAGSYDVVVTNVAGSVTSAAVALTVNTAPTILLPPSNATVLQGQTATFSVGAIGTPAPTYQWQKGTTNIPGATSATLTLPNAQPADAGSYRVVVTNSVGSLTSTAATLTVNYSPVFTTQPVAVTVAVGNSATFTALASGNPGPTYQWRKGGVNISGATSAGLTLSNVQIAHAGSYDVVATNTIGSATSTAVDLTVTAAPTISLTPASTTAVQGETVTFTAAANGSPTPTYQWQKGSTNIAGATAATLTLTNVQPADAGSYRIVATNAHGSATSLAATLTVNFAPVISTQPVARSITAGSSTSFSVTASGSPAPTYQWRREGVNLAGATNATLTLSNVQVSQAGSYDVVVANTLGSTTSAAVALTVHTVPSFTTQPVSATVLQGQTATFTAAASGNPAPTYQWQKNNTILTGETSATLTLPNAQLADAATYWVVAANVAGDTISNGATLTVNAAPVITTQPVNATVASGASAAFTVVATGSPALSYQWQRRASGGAGFTNLPTLSPYGGTMSATLTVSNSSFAFNGDQFRCVISNGIGSPATSNAATLNISQAPAFTSANATSFSLNVANAFSVTASGYPASTFAVSSGALPAWASLNSTTGVISGTPTSATGSPFTFTLQASNGVGTAATQVFTLTVSALPAISTISAPRQVVTRGQDITLSVTAPGATSYQWKRNGRAITGATSTSLAITDAHPLRDNGWYQVVATNGAGSVTSPVVFVNVSITAPQIVGWGYNGYSQTTIPSGLTNVLDVMVGLNSSYAMRADGTLTSWGYGISAPPPSGLANVVSYRVSSAYDPSAIMVALRADGTVVAWGSDNGGNTVVPSGLANVVAIAAGTYHNLALKADGTVVAWGSSFNGGTAVPAGLDNVVAIAAGVNYSLALKSDGTVVGWGQNDYGQSVPPGGLANVAAIRAGAYHALALRTDGTVAAWGRNSDGQATVPAALNSVASFAAGYAHSLALKADGTVVAWGANSWGQRNVPAGLNAVVGLAAGEAHSLALRDTSGDTAPVISAHPVSMTALAGQSVTLSVTASGGSALLTYQWRKNGVNISGATSATLSFALMTGTDAGNYDVVVTNALGSVTSNVGVLTFDPTPAVSIAGGMRQVVTAGQGITLSATSGLTGPLSFQWRRNGQPIAGATGATLAFANASRANFGAYQVLVTGASGSALSQATWIVVAQPTQVVAYGLNSDTQINVPAGLNNAIGVSAGALHSLAVTSTGAAVGWGDSAYGQRNVPSGLTEVVQVSAGAYHSMALRADGTVSTWGRLNYTPAGLNGVMAVAAGNDRTGGSRSDMAMALRFDGSVVGWHNEGVMTDIPAGLIATAIAVGDQWRLALRPDGTVTVLSGVAAPAGLANVVAISAGTIHALALKADGTVVAWGYNTEGQLNVPEGLNNVVAIAANPHESVAIKADGSVVWWGRDDPLRREPVLRAGPAFAVSASDHSLVLRDPTGDTLPVIATQPVGGSVSLNGSKTFAVAATGGLLSYQWRRNGSNLSAFTDSSFTLFSAQAADAGTYDVVVTNYLGSVTSSPAVLTVGNLPSFTTHPLGQSVGLGGTVTLSYAGSGTSPLTAQWRKDGNPITGATASTLTLTNFQAVDTGVYTVALTNPVGTTISNGATLTAVTSFPPVITAQPVGGTLQPGNVGSFSVSVSSAQSYTVQWRRNGVPLSGATSTSLVLGPVQLSHSGVYDVVLTSIGGSVTSAPASLNVASSSLAITSQPATTGVTLNGTATFSVTMSGTAPFTYQWRKNGIAIPGATSDTLTISNAQLADAGAYTVVVMNSLGTITSNEALLVVQTAVPVISTHPLSVTIPIFGNATFTVTASGGPLTYQWRKAGAPLGGATASSYTILSATGSTAGQYDVVVTNAFGSTTSNVATLTVTEAPFVISPPVSTTVTAGQTATFSVIAGGTPAPAYQWQKNTVNIGGATSATLTLPNAQGADAGTYRVQLSNSSGTVFSGNATLTVNTLPVITTPPVDTAVNAGASTLLQVVATGTPTPTYQWRKGGAPISGAIASFLLFNNAQPGAAGSYDVVVTNSVGSVTSNSATLTVNTFPPAITTQPVGATIGVGTNYTLSVVATGSPTLTYQWRLNGVALPTATASSLAILNAQTSYTGSIDVVVTNAYGSVTSSPVRLDVVPRPIALSARLMIGGEPALGLFTVEGPAAKQLLVRAIGPGLAPFGINGLLADPQLEIFNSAGVLITSNDDWSAAPNVPAIVSASGAVGAFGLASGSRDSVVLQSFAPGTYTVRVRGANGAGGIAFLELYDTDLLPGASRIPYVAVRGRAASGESVMLGGLGSNGRGIRSYLLRAIGPTLDAPGQLVNPALLAVREGLLVGNNDDWDAVPADATATTTATTRVAAFPLPAGSRDAAIVLTGNLHNGAHTAQVTGPESTSGLVLLELHDLDATRPVTFPPIIVSPPASQTVAVGASLTLKAIAHGTGPLTYTWRKDELILPGFTTSTLNIPAAATADGGVYSVAVSNSLGTATSLPSVVTVQGTSGGLSATHAVLSGGYVAGGTLTITNTITYTGTASSLGWEVPLPAGWSFASDGGAAGDVKPPVGASGRLEWAWTSPPASPVTFTYTVNIPAGETGDKMLSALAIGRLSTSSQVQTVAPSPNPLTVTPAQRFHSGDTTLDSRISLVELTRMIELYNTRNGTVRTGAYKVATGSTEDGFDPDPERAPNTSASLPRYHSADTRTSTTGSPRNGAIGLLELTRVIELYNYRTGTTRTGHYHVDPTTEDGFAPGP